jgi:linoleoyl-CoA desaturase
LDARPRDPRANWEWDSASTADSWKHAHNFVHHTYTNVLGKDRDLGYAILRIAPDQPWHPIHLAQPVYIVPMALLFEWAIAVYDIELENVRAGTKPWPYAKAELRSLWRKARRRLVKDYVAFPLLSGVSAVPALLGNLTANAVRDVWGHTIIVCGRFPDGAENFTEEQLEHETRGDWYVRQLLGSCNLDGPPLLHLMSGNLSHQIEHHLFPGLPSNRYAALAPESARSANATTCPTPAARCRANTHRSSSASCAWRSPAAASATRTAEQCRPTSVSGWKALAAADPESEYRECSTGPRAGLQLEA